jgi:hypothetical protein
MSGEQEISGEQKISEEQKATLAYLHQQARAGYGHRRPRHMMTDEEFESQYDPQSHREKRIASSLERIAFALESLNVGAVVESKPGPPAYRPPYKAPTTQTQPINLGRPADAQRPNTR